MKKRKILLLLLCFTSVSSILAKRIHTKPSIGQWYGAYKAILGGAFALHGIHALAVNRSCDASLSLSAVLHTHFPEVLDLVLGTHLIYFGVQDIARNQSHSWYVCVQKRVCERFAKVCAIKLAKFGWNYLVHKAFLTTMHSK